jgi:hypothetical protein
MDQKIRRFHSPAFTAKVVLEALKEQKTLAEEFSDKRQQKEQDEHELVQEFYRQIGRLKVEVDYLKKRWVYQSRENQTAHEIALHINKTRNVLPKAV